MIYLKMCGKWAKTKAIMICVLFFLQIGIILLTHSSLKKKDTKNDLSELSTLYNDQDENVFLSVDM